MLAEKHDLERVRVHHRLSRINPLPGGAPLESRFQTQLVVRVT